VKNLSSKTKQKICYLFLPVALCLLPFDFHIEPGFAHQRNAETSVACIFDKDTFSFKGTPIEQARCLLRPVKIYGELDVELKELPKPLEKLIGKKVKISKKKLREFLRKQKIKEEDIGGLLNTKLSTAKLPSGKIVYANYFLIRTGDSITTVDFGSALPEKNFGTKFARDFLKADAKGLQIHIELIQPRRSDPNGFQGNDAIAPAPGFTQGQYDRLALVYLAASVRRGRWLIPSYHAAMDAGIKNAHDDPQNFDLEQWTRSLDVLINSI
jgi:hypothetical protein